MVIKTEFDIFQRVLIRELDLAGVITELKLGSSCIGELIYFVEYWWEGQIRTVWLHAGELAATKNVEKNGHFAQQPQEQNYGTVGYMGNINVGDSYPDVP